MVKIKKNVNEIIVVYDMDDVLWPLNEHACSLTGIDYGKLCQKTARRASSAPERNHK